MRWWEWLFYAHDPEARRLAADNVKLTQALHYRTLAVHDRLSSLEKHLGKPDTHPIPPPAIRLDCGHEDVSWAQDKDGVTWCRGCKQRHFLEAP